jgi:hypothetical protein
MSSSCSQQAGLEADTEITKYTVHSSVMNGMQDKITT